MKDKTIQLDNTQIGHGVVGGIPVIAGQTTLISLKVKFTPLLERERAKYLECLEGILYSNTTSAGHRKLEDYVRENNLNVSVVKSIFMGRQHRGKVTIGVTVSTQKPH